MLWKHLTLILEQQKVLKDAYDAMRNDDLAEVVMVLLEAFRTSNMPLIHKEEKTEERSDVFRKLGNDKLKRREYQATLLMYNQALLFAPPNSRAMKLAYSNRSALLFSMNQFSAALKDIKTVIDMGCPEDIEDKLRKRQHDCEGNLWQEMVFDGRSKSKYAAEYFKFDVEKNSEIPCAIKSVGIRMDTPIPRVLAFRDIEVGQLVAVETAFVSENNRGNPYICCYYCHKAYLNLKPCDKCSFALFCSAHCKCKCIEEYHGIECQIMGVYREAANDSYLIGLGLKTILKMWNISKDWGKIIKASEEMGRISFRKSSRKEIFDVQNPLSLLNFDDELHLNYGRKFNYGIACAMLLRQLLNVPSFIPKLGGDRIRASQAVARVMLGTILFVPHIKMIDAVELVHSSETTVYNTVNVGYFAFTSKLKHACDANLKVVGLNKKIALIAIKPIKKNTELTVSYVLHWTDVTMDLSMHMRNLYVEYGILCGCQVCKNFEDEDATSLTDAQRSCFAKLKVDQIHRIDAFWAEKNVKRLCRGLAVFADRPGSKEYEVLIKLYKQCVYYAQIAATGNKTLT